MEYIVSELPNTYEYYNCPYCQFELYDKNDKYFNRINEYDYNFIILVCPNCKKHYGIFYNYKGKIETIKSPMAQDKFKKSDCYNEYYK